MTPADDFRRTFDKLNRAHRAGRAVTLHASEVKRLMAVLSVAADKVLAAQKPQRRWWQRRG